MFLKVFRGLPFSRGDPLVLEGNLEEICDNIYLGGIVEMGLRGIQDETHIVVVVNY